VCNYEHTVNGTMQPRCECFDPTDTSPGCSDSLLPNGDFFDDGTGLFNDLEEDFFDPLIAVFVDHPDKWTTSSWAWAAGLIVIFLVMLLCICSAFWPEGDKTKASEKSYRGAAPGNGSSSRASSPKKESSSPTKPTSPRVRSESSKHRPSPRTSSAPQTTSVTANSAQRQLSPSGQRQASSQRRPPMERSSLHRESPTNNGVARSSPTYHELLNPSHLSAISPAKQHRTSPKDYPLKLSSPQRQTTSSGTAYQQRGSSLPNTVEM
jgi:hypothetical protein